MKTKYRSIFISDIHLGTKNAKTELLEDFLKHSSAETLYLVGDILDVWKIQQNRWRWNQTHTNIIRRFLTYTKHETKIIYVAGNHDEFLRPMLQYEIGLDNIEFCNQYEHLGLDGKRYLVVHGDLFDGITRLAPWISFMGDRAYDFVVDLNTRFNWIRHKCGFGYWSLSKFLKHKVKKAIDFIFQFENNLSLYCKKRGFDGVICGHIHHPEIKEINGVMYMNDGDWVESCSALVEHFDGRWEIVYWKVYAKD
jgi:UDP-2,3-diacylglucosamine pyrophosphatase LpxH